MVFINNINFFNALVTHLFLFQLSAFLFESIGLEEKSEGFTWERSL